MPLPTGGGGHVGGESVRDTPQLRRLKGGRTLEQSRRSTTLVPGPGRHRAPGRVRVGPSGAFGWKVSVRHSHKLDESYSTYGYKVRIVVVGPDVQLVKYRTLVLVTELRSYIRFSSSFTWHMLRSTRADMNSVLRCASKTNLLPRIVSSFRKTSLLCVCTVLTLFIPTDTS